MRAYGGWRIRNDHIALLQLGFIITKIFSGWFFWRDLSAWSYKEINVALEESKMKEMIKKSNGKRTIPQIFIEDYHVGGYEELRALENKGELDNLLK